MDNNKKALIQTIGLLTLYALIGGIGGPLLFGWLADVGTSNPVLIFVIGLVGVVFIGLGAGISSLAKVTRVQANTAFSYLPIAQDIVVYSVVRGIKTRNALHEKLKKFNWLVTSTVLLIIALLLITASPMLNTKILESVTATSVDETATLIANINIVLNITILGTFLIAYIIRMLYFDCVFALVYKSTLIRILAILPPVHLVLVAILPNQLSYLRNSKVK